MHQARLARNHLHRWHRRSPDRLPDGAWQATVSRVRSEFEEMPCLRVTAQQARVLFGLNDHTTDSILSQLAQEGFLVRTPDGQYVRRNALP